MDQKPTTRDETVSVPPVTLTEVQFSKLLDAVKAHRLDPLDNLHTLDLHQERARVLFETTAIGLGVAGFGIPAAALTRRGCDLILHIPATATRARVYSQSGVRDIVVRGNSDCLPLNDLPPTDRIGRVELFDCHGVLLEVTGAEVPRNPPAVPAR